MAVVQGNQATAQAPEVAASPSFRPSQGRRLPNPRSRTGMPNFEARRPNRGSSVSRTLCDWYASAKFARPWDPTSSNARHGRHTPP
eukprot:scaffold1199_cov265-Pinguiococcus_pyrenoidosus.AAC.9